VCKRFILIKAKVELPSIIQGYYDIKKKKGVGHCTHKPHRAKSQILKYMNL
jgi:hypothetical protein